MNMMATSLIAVMIGMSAAASADTGTLDADSGADANASATASASATTMASTVDAGTALLAAELEVISVMATRNPLPAFDYAGQVSVIERDQILDFNPSTLQDVFQAIPGAQFDNGPRRSGDAPTVRGLTGNAVLIFLDGARQSFISGHDGRFFVDPELVKSVEVVRGPSSALYGSGALGGVVATRTLTAKDYLKDGETAALRMHSGYQSVNDEFRIGMTGAWASEDGVADILSHITYRESGDIALGNGLDLPADDEIASILLKGTYRQSDALEISGSYIQYSLDATDPQNPQGANIAEPGNALVFRDTENQTFQGAVHWAPGSDLIDMNLVAYYSENSVEEDDVDSPRIAARDIETFGISLDNRSRFQLSKTAHLTLTYGAEYYRDRQRGLDTNTASGARGGVPDAETDFIGAFIQAEFDIDQPAGLPGVLNIVPGLRWDQFETTATAGTFSIDEDQFSPKVGISYKPVKQVMIFANYAEGFRAPSFNEAFADGTHFNIPNLSAAPGPFGPQFVANLFINNPNLQSETSETWEFGGGFDFEDLLTAGDSFTVKGSYYRSNVDNLIGLDVNTPLGCFVPTAAFFAPCGTGAAFGNTSQNVNIRNAAISGVEIEFAYMSDYVYARGNFGAINGRDDDNGDFLEGTLSPNTLFLDAGIKYAPLGLRVGSRLTIADEFDEVNDAFEVRDDFVVGDIYAVMEQPLTDSIDLRVDLGVDNVFDTTFEVVNVGVSQPGRNYKAAVALRVGF